MKPFETKLCTAIGALSLVAGVSVFAIRLQHAGPYAWPEGGNLRAGVLALLLGATLVRPWFGAQVAGAGVWATRAALLVTPIVLFFALYATLAELEEVVVLGATQQASGEAAALRLWVVDHEGTPWVTMPRAKADAHGLDDARVELLRNGVTRCVIAQRSDDRELIEQIFRLRYDRYRIQRLATAIGLFGRAPSPQTITLRLAPCPEG